MKLTNKSLSAQPCIRSTAESIQVGMHFRLTPHGRESRKQWYTATKRTADEVTARAVSGFSHTIQISNGVTVLRLLSQDPNLA